jgi:hypothetical protein
MPYDPNGSGAGPQDTLVRRGVKWESTRRLAALAAPAEAAGKAVNGAEFGHGVSPTSREANQRLARDPSEAAVATRQAIVDAGFDVPYTPTRSDAGHHTVILPKPVTDDIAIVFNSVFGRTRKKP